MPHLYLLIFCGDHGLSRRSTVWAGTRNSGPGHIPGVSMDGNRLIKQHSILLPRTKSMKVCLIHWNVHVKWKIILFAKLGFFSLLFFLIEWSFGRHFQRTTECTSTWLHIQMPLHLSLQSALHLLHYPHHQGPGQTTGNHWPLFNIS